MRTLGVVTPASEQTPGIETKTERGQLRHQTRVGLVDWTRSWRGGEGKVGGGRKKGGLIQSLSVTPLRSDLTCVCSQRPSHDGPGGAAVTLTSQTALEPGGPGAA